MGQERVQTKEFDASQTIVGLRRATSRSSVACAVTGSTHTPLLLLLLLGLLAHEDRLMQPTALFSMKLANTTYTTPLL